MWAAFLAQISFAEVRPNVLNPSDSGTYVTKIDLDRNQ
jgi:hypothetical protein